MRASFCRAVLVCILLASAGPAPAQSVKAGIEAWQRADYARALDIWRPLAEAGDPDAAFNLAQAYRLGRGVAVDLALAQSWLERAALKDHVDAQTTLGLLLFQNGDRTGGLRWLKPAAEKGDPRAMLVYGTALFNGDSVAQDQVLGYAFVSRSAAQGLAPAKETLAQMDALIPLEQRKKGLAIATQKAKAAAKAKPKRPKAVAAVNRPAVTSAAPVSTSGRWRIQLGAFSQRASAEALFRRLSGSVPVAGRQQFLVPAGTVTRLQVGPFPSRAAAAAACNTLAARGQACFPVGG
jgi:uncharacterized protein